MSDGPELPTYASATSTVNDPAVPSDRAAALDKAKVHVRDMLLAGSSVAEADAAIERVDLNERTPQSVVDEVHGALLAAHRNEALPGDGLTRGLVGALLGAVVAAAAWAFISSTTGYQIGFAAVGVGYLVARGALQGTGDRKSKSLVIAVAVLTIAAYAVGKYFTIAAQVHKQDASVSIFDPVILTYVRAHPRDFLELFDLLWIAIALSVAVRMVRPTLSKLAPPRQGSPASWN